MARIDNAKLDHIAFGLAQLADAPDTLVGVLGGRTHEGGPNPEFIGCQWQFARGARIEAIAPNDSPTSFMKRFVEMRGQGVHHITFKVSDIYAARDEATAMGYQVTGFSDEYEAWKELFLHPKSAHGVVIQIAQSDPNVPDAAWNRDFAFPPYTGSLEVPGEPADLLGLRMTVNASKHASRLFGELLGGVVSDQESRPIYQWADSPLRVAIEVNAEAPEGPAAIEVSANACGHLTSAGLDAMGGRFELSRD
jgi:methylmalonyl-CoA/ethylmalonyl-CoA epimerase